MTKSSNFKTKWNKFWARNKASEGYLFKKKATEVVIKILRFLLLFGMCFMIVQPLLQKISISFMEEQDLYNTTVISIPQHFTTYNYQLAAEFTNYSKGLKDTFLICFTAAILQIVVCTLVGYGFARFEFPFKKFWFACVLLMIIIPPQTISSSLILHFRYFDIFGIIKAITGHTINLRKGLVPYYILSGVCMGLKNGLYIFMIRQFFRTIPKELEEAAYVDGCGTLKTFIRIMLPDAKPILTSCFLFSFVWQWTDGFYSNLFLNGKKFTILALKLNGIADEFDAYMADLLGVHHGTTIGYINCIVSTNTLMVIAPVLLVYLFAQRGFVESLSSTGLKM